MPPLGEAQCSSLKISGVARVAELGGQAGGKGFDQGGKHNRETEGPTAYRYRLKAPRSLNILDGFRVLQYCQFI